MKYLNDISYKDCVGKVCKSLNSGDFKVLKYNNAKEVEIQFIDTGFETVARLSNIKSGNVKDRYLPSVYGVGVYWSNTNKAFVAKVKKNKGKQEHLGFFKTEIEAFNAYKKSKEAFVKEQAEKWKSQIDERAYNALMNYKVNMDD